MLRFPASMHEPPHRDDPYGPTGDGPYRRSPKRNPRPPKRRVLYVGLGLVAVLVSAFLLLRGEDEPPRAAVAHLSLPQAMPVATFPLSSTLLPEATPLAPLLIADASENLAILQPSPGVQRLSRNDALRVQFNRPMVERSVVGDELSRSPIVLRAAGRVVRGSARWVSRSVVVFRADGSAWNRNLEASLSVREDLRSLDGASLLDERERVVVFDGTPHAVSRGAHRVAAGQPLALFFDNPVTAADLRGDVMAYEVGGGARSLPFALRTRGREEQLFRVDLVPARSLEAGSNIGVALAPRWWTWAGPNPGVMRFMVQPPPQIEGVHCAVDAQSTSGCAFGSAPGRVVDIESQLGILASETLGDSATTSFSVSPRLPGARLTRSDSGRVLTLEGEWRPNQVYEVRFGELRAASGAPLERLGPLAVRSRGRNPSANVQGGSRLSFELDAEPLLHLTGINVHKGAVIYREVSDDELLDAVLAPAAFLRAAHEHHAFTPLVDVLPDARANRQGHGSFRWRSDERPASTAIIGIRAGSSASSATPVFVQRTNLAPTVQTLESGLQVWVTRLSDGTPVSGARVTARSAREDSALIEGTTDSDGLVFLPSEESLLGERIAVAAFEGDDRVALVVEHSRAVGPARLGIYSGGSHQPTPGDSVAAVMSDRGAYRPGTTVRTSAVIRRVNGSAVDTIRDEEFVLRLMSPAQQSPIGEVTATSSDFGFVHAEFALPQNAALGTYTLSVSQPEGFESAELELGTTTVRVANFRQPSFRVDASGPSLVMTDETPSFSVDASYLFGAPVADAEVEWSLLRRGEASPPSSEYRSFVFGPVDASVTPRTEHFRKRAHR